MDDTLKTKITGSGVSTTDAAVKPFMAKTDEAVAIELGRLLKEHNGINVTLIDLRPLSIWTDFFLLATVTSATHLSGLQRRINEFALENKLTVLHGHKKTAYGNGWDICDLGFIAAHLMTEESRSFYELENLWSAGALINL
ncbi:MAG: ribosome silencing factor [Spirochaetaceae bacterium]|jgi:ribosome-associated protein|nr:ribosome silencing factor [Spirochaetaceae bacterium]